MNCETPAINTAEARHDYSHGDWKKMTGTTKVFGVSSLALASLLIAVTAAAADLEVSIEGLRSAEGDVRVALHRYNADVVFPSDGGIVARASRPADTGGVRIIFAGLPPGDYAVAAFHDADGNGELGTNILGIPTEGYGFSNGARGFMGPPSFDDAAVAIGSDDGLLSIVVPIGYPAF